MTKTAKRASRIAGVSRATEPSSLEEMEGIKATLKRSETINGKTFSQKLTGNYLHQKSSYARTF